MTFTQIQTNAKDTQITTVMAVDEMAQAVLDDFQSRGDKFKKNQNHRQLVCCCVTRI